MSLRSKLYVAVILLVTGALAVVLQNALYRYRLHSLPHHWYIIVWKIGFGRVQTNSGPYFWEGPFASATLCERRLVAIITPNPLPSFQFICRSLVDSDASQMQGL